jgi:SAM-dependent methyltransferase
MQHVEILYSRFLHSLREDGFFYTAKRSADFIYRKTVVRYSEWRFDRKWGVQTTGRVTHPQDDSNPLNLSAEPYEATSLKGLRQVMRSTARIAPSIPLSRFAFFDMGCGKGRALVVASGHPFKRVVGVEFCQTLARIAEDNIKRAQSKRSLRAKVEIVCADAASYQFPDEDAFIFFNNPFNEEIMTKVLKNIRASAHTTKARYIIYYNPVLHRLLSDPGQFLLVEEKKKYSIYQMVF